MTRLGLSAAAALALHALAWLALVLLPGLVGRQLAEAPPVPATVDLVLGEGGQTTQPDRGDDTAPTPPAPDAPPPPEPAPPPPPPDPIAPPAPPPPPPPAPPAPPPTPAAPASPPAIRLGTTGRPPHADLLDPDNSRFRAATQDTGNRMPAYPIDAARRLESGTVKLQLFIDPTGRVANALVVRSSGSASLDAAARDQALTWRFTPARRDGKPVTDLVEIEIEFKLI